MGIDGECTIMRMHDVIHIPLGVEHAVDNTGLRDLVFLLITSPLEDQ